MHRFLRRLRHGAQAHTFVCVPCRYANRTGVACPTCGESTRRLYGRTPKRSDLRAWDRLRRTYWRWDNALPYAIRRAVELAARWKRR